MVNRLNRRDMLRNTTLAGVGIWATGRSAWAEAKSPNEKLNLALIGVGWRGRDNLNEVARLSENIVALCDVDDERAGDAFTKFPKARKYYDFRKMLDEMDKQIDAVVVSTPDHTHAVAGVMAMKMGKHCYCEKPLAHSVYEARAMAEVAAKNKVVTQMGTQHHARPHMRRIVEIIQSGAIGPVREAHVWIGGDRGGGERPKDTPPIPPHLKWDLWLGPAPYRPYHPDYVPYKWRFWWDFGTGETGNNGCHIMDLAFWALKLRHPLTVEAEGPAVHPETSPRWMTVHYEFPARGEMPPLKMAWYHAKNGPPILAELVPEKERPTWESGVVFVGQKGTLLGDYSNWKMFPESNFKDFKPPEPTIPDSIGHHKEWIGACKTGGPTTCNFDYSGALAENVLLGNVAYRVGEKLNWDPVGLKATNCAKAEPYIRPPYREGWTL
jgi:predicted dehydrogenase